MTNAIFFIYAENFKGDYPKKKELQFLTKSYNGSRTIIQQDFYMFTKKKQDFYIIEVIIFDNKNSNIYNKN